MELVNFMSNRDAVVENLKEKGFITDDEKVTCKGLMAMQFYLDVSEEKQYSLEDVYTHDMSFEEIEQWEKSNSSASVQFDNGGVLEFLPIEMFNVNDKVRVKSTGMKAMSVSMCDNCYEREISEIVSSKEEIRKLRDCLNKYLEN